MNPPPEEELSSADTLLARLLYVVVVTYELSLDVNVVEVTYELRSLDVAYVPDNKFLLLSMRLPVMAIIAPFR